jgi:hypothetical protein
LVLGINRKKKNPFKTGLLENAFPRSRPEAFLEQCEKPALFHGVQGMPPFDHFGEPFDRIVEI